ncbi:hypothetical protein EXIGLDRAFT_731718 [Exidia glandulosa HHB12029]|uniref:Uncharacterized protein n=1 Tax=Exidia glandulosa HHB12029 TaxID=1314781 RepID=A0A165Z4J5_EXIGL|nr:hypothetical protein EXIGLDRAFT_735356 [Exidia glandulosa HHB12029]KZV81122.1 hypothetical protein EXIGLDRAFT_731718 [Exidia glandulosa HHB12029]
MAQYATEYPPSAARPDVRGGSDEPLMCTEARNLHTEAQISGFQAFADSLQLRESRK